MNLIKSRGKSTNKCEWTSKLNQIWDHIHIYFVNKKTDMLDFRQILVPNSLNTR